MSDDMVWREPEWRNDWMQHEERPNEEIDYEDGTEVPAMSRYRRRCKWCKRLLTKDFPPEVCEEEECLALGVLATHGSLVKKAQDLLRRKKKR